MMTLLYNFFLCCFALISLPKVLLKSEKYKKSWRAKLGLEWPSLPRADFWIHAVSVGETKAAAPLLKQIKERYPKARVVISSTTETGHAEAKRTLKLADAHFFLPLDFSWIMRRISARIQPRVLILMEGEFWYHLIQEAKKQGARILLANGKLSKTSHQRFAFLPQFSKRLFDPIDHLCLQSPLYLERFLDLGIPKSRISVTGNLKFDTPILKLTPSEKEYWKKELGIAPKDRVITIGSTHPEEEEKLLDALNPLWKVIPTLKILLVPRHPERFSTVSALLKKRNLSTISYTELSEKTGRERIVLIDTMGFLLNCYQLSELALVGGSFIPGIGGHNIFEPIQCACPVLFGPHMETQKEFADLIASSSAGKQCSLEDLQGIVQELMQSGSLRARMTASGESLAKSAQGATLRTWETFAPFFSI